MSFDNIPDVPVKSEMYVRLVTKSPIRKESVSSFYNVVKENAPDGTLTHYKIKDNNGNIKMPWLVHRMNKENMHEYEIPLVRNFTNDELYQIVENVSRSFNEGDFLFESSSNDTCCDEEIEREIMPPKIFEELAVLLSERQHNKWLNERMNAGWRFGTTRNDADKTHPLIKPWNQLDESQKSIDYTLPEMFIDLLEQYGYTIVSLEELNNILEK